MTFAQFGHEQFPFMMTKNNTFNNRIIANFEAEKLFEPNEIRSLSDVEVWQKFILFFMKEDHACAEFDLGNENAVAADNTQTTVLQNADEFEEDVAIRQVFVREIHGQKLSWQQNILMFKKKFALKGIEWIVLCNNKQLLILKTLQVLLLVNNIRKKGYYMSIDLSNNLLFCVI